MNVRINCRSILYAASLFLFGSAGFSQIYQVGPDSSKTPSAGQGLGWGSNIQSARLAHAAELALQKGDHALAFSYAQHAAQSAPNDPQLWFLLGYAARLDSKLGSSTDAYQHGLRLNPSSIDGMSGLGQTYAASGRVADAMRLLKQVVAADPNRRNELSMLGDLYVRSGDYEGAIGWLERAERLEPAAQSELLMAVAYEHLKQLDLASHYLELAKSRAPNNPDVERSLAAFYRGSGDYTKAVDALTSIKAPKPDVVAELAYTYGLSGRAEESARTYAQAADLLPRDLGLQLSAAEAQVRIASFDRAESFLQRASKLDPNYYRLHAIRGEIAQTKGDDVQAAREFAAAISSLPADAVEGPLYAIQLHTNLVPLYQNLDEGELSHRELIIAQELMSHLDERGSDRASFLRLRAVIHSDAGELDAALSDMEESLKLNPKDPNSLQLDGDLLMRLGRTSEGIAIFHQVLTIDPHNRFALTSLGYASRAAHNIADAEKYFTLLANEYPSSYVPYLALGDMYTDNHEYKKAEAAYSRAYTLSPQHAMIVAGGMNAAIESHDLPLAGLWQRRVNGRMAGVAQILREEERYFSFMGDSQRSADLGREAIKLIPHDREVVVYLGYDLLRLEQYDELKALMLTYMDIFPKEPAIPLLAGYVYKRTDLNKAVSEFTEALHRDPKVVTAYTNRGFVYNDLRKPSLAAADFKESLRLQPNDAEAHMGLAFAELNLHHPQLAIHQTQLAEAIEGDSELVHTIRATAYGRMQMLTKSVQEYRLALKFNPNDGYSYVGLGNIFFTQRRYQQAISELQMAEKHLPADPSIYALMARANAELGSHEETLRNIQLADKYAATMSNRAEGTGNDVPPSTIVSDTYVSTGEALSTLGDEQAAMDRFTKALLLPSDRVNVRLTIAREMTKQGFAQDAERQIALAQMEVEAKDAQPPTGDQYLAMASILQQLHEYELAETYLDRARDAGAPITAVRISLADNYLAIGDTRRAAAELAAVKQTEDSDLDYQYLLAEASLYQQEHRSAEALSSFAKAAANAGQDATAEEGLLETAGSEGYRLNPTISLLSNFFVQPIFEDSTVYVLDSKLDSPSGPVSPSDIARLPPPRSSIETDLINSFHLHLGWLPTNGGFFQVRNAQGLISVPATGSVVHRNTTDYVLNFGLNPTVHIGSNVVTFNSGIQGTFRRDTLSPIQMNQNMFRVFTYATTSSFWNAISAAGYISAEVGPFTETPINEKILTGAINFRVGTPWGNTALITGWDLNSQSFDSSQLGNGHNFYTSSYVGLSRRFSSRFSIEAIIEDLRAWRIEPYSPIHSAIAQALRPAATIRYTPNDHWDIQASSSYQNTRGFHVYDMMQNSLTVGYVRSLDRTFNESSGKVHLKYPIRFAAGVRQEGFPNFTQGTTEKFVPVFSLTIF